MAHLPYYSWFPSEFSSSTSHFTFNERAIYRELLDWSWLNGPLPQDDRRLAKLCGCSLRTWRASWPQVRTKFEENGDGLVNRRLEVIRQKTIELSEKRAEAGRIGGEASAKQMPPVSLSKTEATAKHVDVDVDVDVSRNPPKPPQRGGRKRDKGKGSSWTAPPGPDPDAKIRGIAKRKLEELDLEVPDMAGWSRTEIWAYFTSKTGQELSS